MNNLTSAFSLYEALRVLLPGFYTTIMLKNIAFTSYRNPTYSDIADGWIIFLVFSVIIGGLLYSMDVPRWFKQLYTTLPSNMIEKNGNLVKPEGESNRYFENEFFKFYYNMQADAKFKTEIQSGFFHLFMTMAFVSLLFIIIYCYLCTKNPLNCNYQIQNALVFFICLLSAFIMYKIKLKYSWKRDYELFLVSLRQKSQ
jgi:predicted membrane channel-forming protein YqfA (hemolysin III family)